MDQKAYIKEVYSKYWLDAREKKYGFKKYDRNLCDLSASVFKKNSSLLDVACGTGYPYADFFSSAYKVTGMDIADSLIKKARNLYPGIDFKIGDAENIPFADEFFDGAYCFQSFWYFPAPLKAISEMTRVVKKGGFFVFDFTNFYNDQVKKVCGAERFMNENIFGMIGKYLKNIIKLASKKGTADWRFISVTNPSKPDELLDFLLKSAGAVSVKILAQREDESLVAPESKDGRFTDYERLIFIVKK